MDGDIKVQVYDNVVTTAFSQPIPTTTFARVFIQATAIRPSNGDSKSWYFTVSAIRAAGALSVSSVVNIITPIADAGAAGWNLTVLAVGNNLVIQVQGQNLDTTIWRIKYASLATLD